MSSILFGDLPFVTTGEELAVQKAAHPGCDPYYIASGCIQERRMIFESLWPAFEPFADSNFLLELKKHFHQRTWEMFIGNLLLKKGLHLSQHSDEGPDFLIVGDNAIYIECVAVTKGATDNPDAVPEAYSARLGEQSRIQKVPQGPILLRITQAIKEKSDKHQKWRAKPWFSPDIPYVIALNTGDLNYLGYPDMPYVLKALFGVSHPFLEFEPGTNYRSEGWQFRETIQRHSGADVPVNLFTVPDIRHVSGIIFSDYNVVNHEGKECFIVNNPFAENPLPHDFISHFNGWNAWINEEYIFIEKMPMP